MATRKGKKTTKPRTGCTPAVRYKPTGEVSAGIDPKGKLPADVERGCMRHGNFEKE